MIGDQIPRTSCTSVLLVASPSDMAWKPLMVKPFPSNSMPGTGIWFSRSKTV